MAKFPEPKAEGPCPREGSGGVHLWELRKEKPIRAFIYYFWHCVLCDANTMTIETMAPTPNGHVN